MYLNNCHFIPWLEQILFVSASLADHVSNFSRCSLHLHSLVKGDELAVDQEKEELSILCWDWKRKEFSFLFSSYSSLSAGNVCRQENILYPGVNGETDSGSGLQISSRILIDVLPQDAGTRLHLFGCLIMKTKTWIHKVLTAINLPVVVVLSLWQRFKTHTIFHFKRVLAHAGSW